jgi:hypothetical protein
MSISILFLPVALVILGSAQQAAKRSASTGNTAESVREAKPVRDSVCFPTSFMDAKLLLESLREFGAQPVQTDTGNIFCQIGECELRFTQRDGQAFSAEIRGAPSMEEARKHLANLDEDYRRCVQTAVYEKVKARAESRGLMLESEEVLEDRTILMTLRVR